MTQARLRLSVFFLWLSFWALSIGTVFVAPLVRVDIEKVDVLPAVYSVSVIWIPAVSCLAGFWFPQQKKSSARSVRVSKEKTCAALTLTITYLMLVFSLIVYSTFVVNANTEIADAGSVTLLGQLAESVKLALFISPVALAPISWLTGGTSSRSTTERAPTGT